MAVGTEYFYHNTCLLIIQRAFGAPKIFLTQGEYDFYLRLMKQYKSMYQVRIFSFCLFPASIYLVIGAADLKTACDFLEVLNQAYCAAVACRESDRSALQIQRSRILVIEDEPSLFDLVSFVETFPVKRGDVPREEDYFWSSFSFRLKGGADALLETWDPNI